MGSNPFRSLPAACAVLLLACAQAPRTGEGNPPAASRADALLPSGRNLFAFDFARARYQSLPLSRGPADSGAACRALDSVRAGWPRPEGWLALPAPGRPFAPMQAAWGPSGNFFLLDRVSKRLGLYDTSAQFLSGIPLPAEIRERNLESFQVFWSRDGGFTFLDRDEGRVWQYAELRAAGGHGDWRLRHSARLPLDLGPCLWEPFFREPCCLAAAGKGDGAILGTCFDIYFNRIGPLRPGEPGAAAGPFPAGIRAVPAGGEWKLILEGGPACAAPPACHHAVGAAFTSCPAEPDPAAPK